MKKSIVTCLAIFSAMGASPYPTSIDKDGMLLVNGERCFVLGLYQAANDNDFAAEVAEAGFNLVRAERSSDALDLRPCWAERFRSFNWTTIRHHAGPLISRCCK